MITNSDINLGPRLKETTKKIQQSVGATADVAKTLTIPGRY